MFPSKGGTMSFVLYRSSAGSGKTYTLVKEYLKMILQNPGKFKHILAITFTNKAAGEMKDRIMQSLKKLAKGEDKILENTLLQELPQLQQMRDIDKLSSDILTSLLHNYSDFAIMTIDSFIHKVIKAFALEIGLPLNFGIDLNYEKIESYVIERLLANVGKNCVLSRPGREKLEHRRRYP
jgi:ATP-dependent helicase/nuclease subunit A